MIFLPLQYDSELPNVRLTYSLLNVADSELITKIGAIKGIRTLALHDPKSPYHSLKGAKDLVEMFDEFIRSRFKDGGWIFSVVVKRDDAIQDQACIAVMAAFLGFAIQLTKIERCS